MRSATFSSEQARLNWRDMIDKAMSGMKVIIERYGKPNVVMVSVEVFEDLQRRAELADPWAFLDKRNRPDGPRVSLEEIDRKRGPLNELYELVSGEEEWNEIIYLALKRAGVDDLQDNEEAVFAEIENQMEPLRQRQKVAV